MVRRVFLLVLSTVALVVGRLLLPPHLPNVTGAFETVAYLFTGAMIGAWGLAHGYRMRERWLYLGLVVTLVAAQITAVYYHW